MERVRSAVMTRIVHFYEHYMLPRDLNRSRPSLLELKQQEFEDRKLMLNPYQKSLVLQDREHGLIMRDSRSL